MDLRKFDTKKTIGVTLKCGKPKQPQAPCGPGLDEEEDGDPFCKGPFLCLEKLRHPESAEKIKGCKDYLPIVVKPCKPEERPHPCDPKPCCDDDEYIKQKKKKNDLCPTPALCIFKIRHPYNSQKVDEDCDDGSGVNNSSLGFKKPEKPKCCAKKKKRSPSPQRKKYNDD